MRQVIAIYLLLLAACTQQNEKAFPFEENEFAPPILVKATPIVNKIPKYIPPAKYTTIKGALVIQDSSVSLKPPVKVKLGKPRIKTNEINSKVLATPKLLPIERLEYVKTDPVVVRSTFDLKPAGLPKSLNFIQADVRDNDCYGIRYLTQTQGLPGTVVQSVLHDRSGRIWIGTYNGLALLDGSHVQLYTVNEGLSSNVIFSILEDSKGQIWIGTFGGGVNVYSSGKFKKFGVEQGLSSNLVTCLYEDKEGSIWIGTRGGVSVFEEGYLSKFDTQNGLSHNWVRTIIEDENGAIWIGTEGGGVSIYDNGYFSKMDEENGLSNNVVFDLLEDDVGKIWIATAAGVNVYDSDKLLQYGVDQGLNYPIVESLLQDNEGSIWVGTYGGGINILKDGAFRYINSKNGLSHDLVISLTQAANGSIWAGTFDGANVYTKGFIQLGTNHGLSHQLVTCLMEEDGGNLWIGTYGEGVSLFDGKDFIEYKETEGLTNDIIRSILQDSEGRIWIGTKNGLNVLKDNVITQYGTDQGLSNNIIRCLLEDRKGRIWIGTERGGVNVYDNGSFTHYTTNEGLSDNTVFSLLEDTGGDIWIGTLEGGVNIYKDSIFIQYNKEAGLSHNSVYSLLANKENVWIGTNGGGLNIYKDGYFVHYDTDHGLADLAVMQLASDTFGQVWVGTNNGLSQFLPNPGGGYAIKNWDRGNGFNHVNFHGPGNPMLITKTDKVSPKESMWVAVGPSLVNFTVQKQDSIPPKLFLTGLDIKNQRIDWQNMMTQKKGDFESLLIESHQGQHGKGNNVPDSSTFLTTKIDLSGIDSLAPYFLPQDLSLAADQNHVTFHYSGMRFDEQGDIVYRFLLEGYDESWSSLTKESKADYKSLPPGKYKFRVRARSRNLIWSEEASISFKILPPWWMTWWALSLMGVIIVGFLNVAHRWRMRSLLKNKKELERVVKERTQVIAEQKENLQKLFNKNQELMETQSRWFINMAHELRTPLTLITGPIRHFLDHYCTGLSRTAREDMELIERNGQHLTKLVNSLLDITKLEQGKLKLHFKTTNLGQLIRNVVTMFNSEAQHNGIFLEYTGHDSILVRLDEKKIETVLINLISNALKFTYQGGKVAVSCTLKENENVLVEVLDTGTGISEKEIPYVFDRFYQAPSSHKNGVSIGGSGIGLALSREIIRLHNGDLRVESEVGKGSVFSIELPRELISNVTIDEDNEEIVKDFSNETSKKSIEESELESTQEVGMKKSAYILLVDDSSDMRLYINKLLEPHYHVMQAIDGKAALDMLCEDADSVRLEAFPDLIISDIMMPRMNGLELAKQIKKLFPKQYVPFIFLSAMADNSDRLKGLQIGVDDYITKPFGQQELLVRIKNLLKNAGYRKSTPENDEDASTSEAFDESYSQRIIRQLKEEVLSKINDPKLSVDYIAEALAMNRMTLTRILKKECGLTPGKFIRHIRLRQALIYLEQKQYSTVQQVAYAIGFENPSKFANAFEKRFGKKPSEYLNH